MKRFLLLMFTVVGFALFTGCGDSSEELCEEFESACGGEQSQMSCENTEDLSDEEKDQVRCMIDACKGKKEMSECVQ